MSNDINKVMLTGNLTKDAEVRANPAGDTCLCFRLASSDRARKKGTAEWEDHANYVNCVWWHKAAYELAESLGKGSKVALEGKLRTSEFEDKRGNKRTGFEIQVSTLQFLSAPKGKHAQ